MFQNIIKGVIIYATVGYCVNKACKLIISRNVPEPQQDEDQVEWESYNWSIERFNRGAYIAGTQWILLPIYMYTYRDFGYHRRRNHIDDPVTYFLFVLGNGLKLIPMGLRWE